MAALSFKSKYIDDILAGRKTSTMRRVGSPANPKAGTEFTLKCGRYSPPFAKAKCISVTPIFVSDITDRMAKLDGFANAAALQTQLRETYGPNIRRVDVIKFQLIETYQKGTA